MKRSINQSNCRVQYNLPPPSDGQCYEASQVPPSGGKNYATSHNVSSLICSPDDTNIFDQSLKQSQYDSRCDSRVTYRFACVEIFALSRANLTPDPEFDPIRAIAFTQ